MLSMVRRVALVAFLASAGGVPVTDRDIHASSADGYPFYYGSGMPVYHIPRTVTDRTPAEVVHYFPLDLAVNSKIAKITRHGGKFVQIPLYTHLQAGYAKTQHNNQEWESGLSNLALFTNGMSVMSDKTGPAYFAEKAHATMHTGTPYGNASAYGAKARIAKRSEMDFAKATTQKSERDWAIVAAAAAVDFGARLVEASTDVTLATRLRQYVNEKEGTPAGFKKGLSSYKKLLKDAVEGMSRASTTTEVRSTNGCFHFEEFPGMEIDASGEYLLVPLDTNLVGLVGQVVFSPMRVFHFNMGTAFFTIDKTRNALVIHYNVASHSFLPDKVPAAQPGYAANLFVGPIDGMSNLKPARADGRTSEFTSPPSVAGIILYQTAQKIPEDYARLYADDVAETCTPDDVRSLAGHLTKGLIPHREVPDHAQLWNTMLDTANNVDLGAAIAGGVDCAKTYLRSAVPYTTAFDFFELGVWGHYLAEQTDEGADKSFSSRFWDDGIKRQVGVKPAPHLVANVADKLVDRYTTPLGKKVTGFLGFGAEETAEELSAGGGEDARGEEGESFATAVSAADILRHHLRDVTEEEWEAERESTKRSVERMLGEPFVPKGAAPK